MFLAIDIGNTNIKAALYNEDSLQKVFRFETEKSLGKEYYLKIFEENLSSFDIKNCAISSVVSDLGNIIKEVCDSIFKIDSVILDTDKCDMIKVKTVNSDKVGIDRIANSYAASMYKLPAIVVDIGTAVNFDIISENKEFIGGIIMPGPGIQLKSLFVNASKLPKIDLKASDKAVGDTTETSILSGVVRGIASAIDGLIIQCEEELGVKSNIILTGGYCELISQYMKTKASLVEKNLTVFGVKLMYDRLYKG